MTQCRFNVGPHIHDIRRWQCFVFALGVNLVKMLFSQCWVTVQRLWRWPNIDSTLRQRLEFIGMCHRWLNDEWWLVQDILSCHDFMPMASHVVLYWQIVLARHFMCLPSHDICSQGSDHNPAFLPICLWQYKLWQLISHICHCSWAITLLIILINPFFWFFTRWICFVFYIIFIILPCKLYQLNCQRGLSFKYKANTAV